MKNQFLPFIVAISPFLLAGPGSNLQAVFQNYNQIQTALSADDLERSKNESILFTKILDTIETRKLKRGVKMQWEHQRPLLKKTSTLASKATNIEEMRLHFAEISRMMIELYNLAQPEGIYHFRCPMAFDSKGGDWLQKGEDPQNPYYRGLMRNCEYRVFSKSKKKTASPQPAQSDGHSHQH